MLNQQTIHKLYELKLNGMAEALADQLNQPDMDRLSFTERFSLIVDRQWTWKENNRLERYLNPSSWSKEQIWAYFVSFADLP